MTLWRSKDCTYGEDRVTTGSSGARVGIIMRAHAHMPRARRTLSPRRASAGRASPSTAERSTSYCAAIADETTNGQASDRAIPPFFLHRRHARSSSDVYQDQIPFEPALPVRVPESALRA